MFQRNPSAWITSRKCAKKMCVHKYLYAKRIARQQWRAWIETSIAEQRFAQLKRIARQQWRAWIETRLRRPAVSPSRHRPPAMAGVD